MRRLAVVLSAAVMVGAAASAPAEASGDRAQASICVQDSTAIPGAVRAATSELDATPQIRVVYRHGSGRCPAAAMRVLVWQGAYGAARPLAWTVLSAAEHSTARHWVESTGANRHLVLAHRVSAPAVIRVNTDGRATTAPGWPLTQRQATLVVLHELLHVVMNPAGPDWSPVGHTLHCASVMAHTRWCIYQQGGLTAYDRAWIARMYR